MHVVCHATTDLKFGSCTALSSSSPVIEASKLIEVESQSQTPSLQLRCRHQCGLLTISAMQLLVVMSNLQGPPVDRKYLGSG